MSGDIQNKKLPKASQRMVRSLVDFVDSNFFQKQLIKLRAAYNIPKDGLSLSSNEQIKTLSPFSFPKEWRYAKDKSTQKKFNSDMQEINEKFSFSHPLLDTIFRGYVFYNQLANTLANEVSLIQNLCKIVDQREEVSERAGVASSYCDYMQREAKDYPIAIRISPDASLRTIKEYVEKVYSGLIAPMQKKYQKQESRLGKTRSRRRAAINKRIYELRHEPKKEIQKKIKDEFNVFLGYEEISPALDSERKRRRQV